MGSGNPEIETIGVNVADSGAGALAMTCTQRIVQTSVFADCATEDYSLATPLVETYTTGTSTGVLTNHCPGLAAPPDAVPAFSNVGENFNCAVWGVENTDGILTYALPTEEPNGILTGDGSNVGVLAD